MTLDNFKKSTLHTDRQKFYDIICQSTDVYLTRKSYGRGFSEECLCSKYFAMNCCVVQGSA